MGLSQSISRWLRCPFSEEHQAWAGAQDAPPPAASEELPPSVRAPQRPWKAGAAPGAGEPMTRSGGYSPWPLGGRLRPRRLRTHKLQRVSLTPRDRLREALCRDGGRCQETPWQTASASSRWCRRQCSAEETRRRCHTPRVLLLDVREKPGFEASRRRAQEPRGLAPASCCPPAGRRRRATRKGPRGRSDTSQAPGTAGRRAARRHRLLPHRRTVRLHQVPRHCRPAELRDHRPYGRRTLRWLRWGRDN